MPPSDTIRGDIFNLGDDRNHPMVPAVEQLVRDMYDQESAMERRPEQVLFVDCVHCPAEYATNPPDLAWLWWMGRMIFNPVIPARFRNREVNYDIRAAVVDLPGEHQFLIAIKRIWPVHPLSEEQGGDSPDDPPSGPGGSSGIGSPSGTGSSSNPGTSSCPRGSAGSGNSGSSTAPPPPPPSSSTRNAPSPPTSSTSAPSPLPNMPRRFPQYDDYRSSVQQIMSSSSDTDYLDQLIPALKDASNNNRTAAFMQSLSHYADEKEAEIEQIGLTKHDEFLRSVDQLQSVRQGTVALTADILQLNESIQASTESLAAQKEKLVETKAIRQNISEASDGLKDSLDILHALNQAHELIRKRKYYPALKSLDDLQNEHLVPIIQNKYATQHKLAVMIQKSIPASQKLISDHVMNDLNTWLYRIRETSQFLGEVAFYHTNLRQKRQKERLEANLSLKTYSLNSAIELVVDESEEFDVLDNDEVSVEFVPLFEAIHIHEALGQSEKFKQEYAVTRRQQKDLLLPSSISLNEDEENGLSSLLEAIAGFAIIEKATMRRCSNLRSPVEVDELWDSMVQTAMKLITKALDDVDRADVILQKKEIIALFIQTMEGWGYSVSALDNFLLILFEKYADLLQKTFSDDFQEIVSTDDYMPMAIATYEEFQKVRTVSWFTPDEEPTTFPCVLPFSQMYPLSCIDIRNFLNQFYFFADNHFRHPHIIDETLKKSLDNLLSQQVCKILVERLNSQYLGQIVQILINLEYFENACRELELLLVQARSSTSAGGPIVLSATEEFRSNKKTAEKRIFELVNSKIDDLVETAEYDWMAPTLEAEPSSYMSTLTQYLSNIMTSTLLGLPREIKELIYFDALSHTANLILALPLSPNVKKINPNGVAALAKDVAYLSSFIDTLDNAPILKQNLDELEQTVQLMQTDNPDEFYDIGVRNRKFGRVDAMSGPLLLEKLTHSVQSPRNDRLANFSSRFGMK